MPRVIAVFGPTGSGKSDVAVRLAARLGTEVVNCDPAQCYRGLPILTNQPGPELDRVAPHRLIGVWPLKRAASFADFAQEAHASIDELIRDRGAVVVCGGSGLYLQAAITELAEDVHGGAQAHDPVERAELERAYDERGGHALIAELHELDARVAARLHPNDRPRIVRALEVARSGRSIAPDGRSHWDAKLRHATLLVGLAVDRQVIRQRITRRTAQMFERGLLEEVAGIVGEHAEHADAALSHTARKLHGLADCIAILDGSISEHEGMERMATRTRQYAKRQDTWARRWPSLVSIDATSADADEVAERVRAARLGCEA